MTFDISRSILSHADAQTLQEALKITKCRIGVEEVLHIRPYMTISQAEALLVKGCRDGVLEISEPFYDATSKGLSLLHSGVAPRFDRSHADKVIAKAISAARKWNKNQDNVAVITELRLFGSALKSRDSYGDVDIEIHTAIRSVSTEAMALHVEALPSSVTRTYEGYSHPELMVKERSARAARKAINRSAREISFCRAGTIRDIGADHMQIYCYDPKQDIEVAAEMIHHPRTSPRSEPETLDHTCESQIMPPIVAPTPPTWAFWSSRLGDLADGYWRGTTSSAGGRRPQAPEDFKRHEDRIANMAWLEGCPAWPLQATDPIKALHELHSRGQEVGTLTSGDLFFHIDGKFISVEFPLSKEEGTSLMVSAKINGKKADLNLVPVTVPAHQGHMFGYLTPIQLSPEHVSIARSAGQHLMAIYRMIAPAAGMNLALSFTMNDEQEMSKLPRLTQMMNAFKSKEINILKKDFDAGLADAKKRMIQGEYDVLEVRQTLTVDVECGDPFIPGMKHGNVIDITCQESLKTRINLSYDKKCTSLYDWEAKSDQLISTFQTLADTTLSFHLQMSRTNQIDIDLENEDSELPEEQAQRKGVVLRDRACATPQVSYPYAA
jgi:hypothetical protein